MRNCSILFRYLYGMQVCAKNFYSNNQNGREKEKKEGKEEIEELIT